MYLSIYIYIFIYISISYLFKGRSLRTKRVERRGKTFKIFISRLKIYQNILRKFIKYKYKVCVYVYVYVFIYIYIDIDIYISYLFKGRSIRTKRVERRGKTFKSFITRLKIFKFLIPSSEINCWWWWWWW